MPLINDNISDIAIEHTNRIDAEVWIFGDEELEQFSHALILRCCRILHERHAGNNPYDSPDIMAIKEHFGIEVNAHMKDK